MATKRATPKHRSRRKAATADVLAAPDPRNHVPLKWRKYYDDLVRWRNHLLSRQSDLVNESAQEQTHFSLHMADAATDSYDRDFALARLSSGQDAVYEIELALNRIRTGTYGLCELTGRPIEKERLRAIPWTRFCSTAEKKLEKDGVVHGTRFAPREPVSGTAPSLSDTEELKETEPSEEE